ncbi:uncharacterized protein LOC103996457 isoform X1 [Musa acuminata AAA Group]|uniref:uncharacterized protein LOC103996457 isoform X1 n=1 Tax=Musa acuminata AAA Group TaxID=214697 RepID=UPI0031E391B9
MTSLTRSQFPVLEFLGEKSKKEKKREGFRFFSLKFDVVLTLWFDGYQIVYMHGFLKLHRLQKAFIVDALNSLDLMRPDRSTVQGQVATPVGVALSLEEAKQDIAALGWQECPLGSIITVGTAADAVEAAVPVSVSTSLSHSKPSSAAGGSAQHKSSGKKKRKRTSAAVASQPSLPPQM